MLLFFLVVGRNNSKHSVLYQTSPQYCIFSFAEHLCDECGKGFTTRTSLQAHKQIHEANLVKCPSCPYRATARQMTGHIRRVHPSGGSFTCHICSKEFRASQFLTTHMSRLHFTGYLVQFIPDFRANNFRCISYTEIHTRTDADRKYPCNQCSHRAYTNYKLQYHIRATHVTVPGILNFNISLESTNIVDLKSSMLCWFAFNLNLVYRLSVSTLRQIVQARWRFE